MRTAGSVTDDEVLGGPLGTVLVGGSGNSGAWLVMRWGSGEVERLLKHFHGGRGGGKVEVMEWHCVHVEDVMIAERHACE